MQIHRAEFKTSAPDLRSAPAWALPEFALIGRSNVGKSSLVNLLTGRRDLAKVSEVPGKTQLLNFFTIDNRWSLVDLPGYGYAQVSRQKRFEFNQAVADYIIQRENLRLVFVLIDSRLPPQAIDLEFLQWIREAGVPFALVFTKTDKQSASQTRTNVDTFKRTLTEQGFAVPDVLLTSSTKKAGRGEVLNFIAAQLA